MKKKIVVENAIKLKWFHYSINIFKEIFLPDNKEFSLILSFS